MSIRRTHSPHVLLLTVAVAATLAMAGAAGAAGPFDGTYSGSQTVQLNNNYQGCADRNIALVIRNSHFTRPWGGDEFGFDVASDGTFNKTGFYNAGRGRQAQVTVTGKIVGASLEANIGSDRCKMHLSLKTS
jgi:hypothetical protein